MKGVSPNPGGRPKSGLIDFIRARTGDGQTIVTFLHAVMDGKLPAVEPDGEAIYPRVADRVRAGEILLASGFVKPTVEVASAEGQPLVVQVVTLGSKPEEKP